MILIFLWITCRMMMGKMVESGMEGCGKRTKNACARFTSNKCSHEQPIVNLWKICKLYPFSHICSCLIHRFFHFSPDNIHYHVYIYAQTGGSFQNCLTISEAKSHALSTLSFPHQNYCNFNISATIKITKIIKVILTKTLTTNPLHPLKFQQS